MRELFTPTTISIIAIGIIALALFIYDYFNAKTESIYGRVIDKVYLPDWNTESFGYEQYLLVIDADGEQITIRCHYGLYSSVEIDGIVRIEHLKGKFTNWTYEINAILD